MFRLVLATAICFSTSLAHAAPATVRVSATATAEEITGDSGCQVFNIYPKLANRVKWTGGCKDGFAHGPGTLEFDMKKLNRLRGHFSRYEGNVERGRPHGEGKLRYSDGTAYQGGFSEGRYHGSGKLETSQFTYEGEWKNGAQHGKGKIVYTYGGSYDGEWVDAQFHGKGVLTYAGGRTVAGDFVKGALGGVAPHSETATGEGDDTVPAKPIAGRWIWDTAFSTAVPPVLAYHEMTPGQRQTIRNQYPLLDETDEPPYPLHGKASIVRSVGNLPAFTEENGVQEWKEAKGMLKMEVMISAAGKATWVKFHAFPHAIVARMAALELVNAKYKPALCQGKPCAMMFPFAVYVDTI